MMSGRSTNLRTHRRGSTLAACVLGFLAFAALAGAARYIPSTRISGHPYVIDGDSLRFGASDVRLEGIDAPELAQSCALDGKPVPCGRDARAELARLVGRREVVCEIVGRDRFGRSLGRCEAGGESLNAAMVAGGHAVSFRRHLAEEAAAKSAKRGLWATTFDPPREWREKNGRPAR